MERNGPLLTRREFATGLALTALTIEFPAFAETGREILIYKNPGCECCDLWVAHLREAGFSTQIFQRGGVTELKLKWGVPPALHSCHTAKIAGYVIEGHVPASAIERLLRERPDAIGLAVPGMPIGSPGMEGGAPQDYDVVLFGKDTQKVFARYREKTELPL